MLYSSMNSKPNSAEFQLYFLGLHVEYKLLVFFKNVSEERSVFFASKTPIFGILPTVIRI